ncbi:uncharacterized protein LOC107636504 [Arachis ipaensis]|uniref:uncharacterized protein LOC107636504 n=1 Tax=Arachis ipaensis TaxID=130454 RepID=UPI0007AFA84E|nr:uncharacterized protein LOC107636504 [Arachis ipaensis]
MEASQVAAIHTQPLAREGSNTEEEEVNYIGNSARQEHDPYSKTYNPGWKNHPNFGWEKQQNQNQNHRPHNPNHYNNSTHQHPNQRPYQTTQNMYSQPPYQNQNNQPQHPTSNPPSNDRFSQIEDMLKNLCRESEDNKTFKEEVRTSMKNRGELIKKLESEVGYLSQQISKSTDSFPNDTEKNPRGGTQNVRWEECKAINLASEEVWKEEISNLTKHNQRVLEEKKEEIEQRTDPAQGRESKEKKILQPYVLQAPFPQRLRGSEKGKTYTRFLDVFKTLHVNIPFLETLKQMPTCIKWMKELLARKSNLKGGQIVVMNTECSALIQKALPIKKGDSRSFHIPCAIGDTIIDRGFCDLGAIFTDHLRETILGYW